MLKAVIGLNGVMPLMMAGNRIQRFRQWVQYLRPLYGEWYITGPLWLWDAWYNSKEPRYEINDKDNPQ